MSKIYGFLLRRFMWEGLSHVKINKRYRNPNGHSRIDNTDTSSTLGIGDEEKQTTISTQKTNRMSEQYGPTKKTWVNSGAHEV